MYETEADLAAVQELLDASYGRANAHLRGIWGPESRLDAGELSEDLVGIQVLDLATVTPRGEPRVAPVDGFFYRGNFWFGSSPPPQGVSQNPRNPRRQRVFDARRGNLLGAGARQGRRGRPTRGRRRRLRADAARALRLQLGRVPPGGAVRAHRSRHPAGVQAALTAERSDPRHEQRRLQLLLRAAVCVSDIAAGAAESGFLPVGQRPRVHAHVGSVGPQHLERLAGD